jgi:hypothetical protein
MANPLLRNSTTVTVFSILFAGIFLSDEKLRSHPSLASMAHWYGRNRRVIAGVAARLFGALALAVFGAVAGPWKLEGVSPLLLWASYAVAGMVTAFAVMRGDRVLALRVYDAPAYQRALAAQKEHLLCQGYAKRVLAQGRELLNVDLPVLQTLVNAERAYKEAEDQIAAKFGVLAHPNPDSKARLTQLARPTRRPPSRR